MCLFFFQSDHRGEKTTIIFISFKLGLTLNYVINFVWSLELIKRKGNAMSGCVDVPVHHNNSIYVGSVGMWVCLYMFREMVFRRLPTYDHIHLNCCYYQVFRVTVCSFDSWTCVYVCSTILFACLDWQQYSQRQFFLFATEKVFICVSIVAPIFMLWLCVCETQ